MFNVHNAYYYIYTMFSNSFMYNKCIACSVQYLNMYDMLIDAFVYLIEGKANRLSVHETPSS